MANIVIKKIIYAKDSKLFELNVDDLTNNFPIATDAEYGKVKLSDATNAIYDALSGYAATPKAIKTVSDNLTNLTTTVNEVKTSTDLAIENTNVNSQEIEKINTLLGNGKVEYVTSIPETPEDNCLYVLSDDTDAFIEDDIYASKTDVGDIANLETNAKDSIVSAINEIKNTGTGGSGGFEIGDIGISVFPIDENQMKRRYLNGQTILIEQYQSFTEKLKSAIEKYPSLSCTESEWQEIVSNSDVGQCGKFVLDESAGTIRLPKIIMPIQGLIDLSSLGEIVNSGLPNIEGSYKSYVSTNNPLINKRGAFSSSFVNGTAKTSSTNGSGDINIKFDASQSNPIYGNSETVQQEQIQYPYFIQVATSVEETVPAEKELILNNPYSLLEHKIVDCKLNNLSWLRSEGQFNSGDTYSDAYNLLLSEKTTPTRDFSIKTSDEAYTDYDFVLNTTDKTFRLPLFTSERQLVEKKEPTDDDPTWYNLYSDGWVEQGGIHTSNANQTDTIIFPKVFSNTNISVLITDNSGGYANTSHAIFFQAWDITTTSFKVRGKDNDNLGAKKSWIACGYSDEKPSSASNLYYYVGDTVQNASLINAGRIEEKIVDLIPNNSELITNYCTPDYSAVILTNDCPLEGTPFVAPSDGFFIVIGDWVTLPGAEIFINNYNLGLILYEAASGIAPQELSLVLGKSDSLYFTMKPATASGTSFKAVFIPFKGVNQNA